MDSKHSMIHGESDGLRRGLLGQENPNEDAAVGLKYFIMEWMGLQGFKAQGACREFLHGLLNVITDPLVLEFAVHVE